MMAALSAVMGALGLVCLLMRRTLLGMMVGIQLLVIGSTMMLVVAGVESGGLTQGHVFGLFVTLIGVSQLVVGYAFIVRLFYLKKKVGIEEIGSLKN